MRIQRAGDSRAGDDSPRSPSDMGSDTRRIGRPRHAVTWATGSSAVLVALLLATGAQASSVGPRTTVFKAPFKGVIVSKSVTTSSSGCGVAKILRPAAFSGTTAVGGFLAVTKIPSCKGPLGSSGSISGGFNLDIPVKLKSGAHTITVNWSDRISYSLVIKMGNCPTGTQSSWDCYQSGGLDLNGYASLLDWTSGTGQYPSNSWAGLHLLVYNYTSCSSTAGCSSSKSGGTGGSHSGWSNLTWFINATALNSSHHYYVVTSLYYDEYTAIGAYNTMVVGGVKTAPSTSPPSGTGPDLPRSPVPDVRHPPPVALSSSGPPRPPPIRWATDTRLSPRSWSPMCGGSEGNDHSSATSSKSRQHSTLSTWAC